MTQSKILKCEFEISYWSPRTGTRVRGGTSPERPGVQTSDAPDRHAGSRGQTLELQHRCAFHVEGPTPQCVQRGVHIVAPITGVLVRGIACIDGRRISLFGFEQRLNRRIIDRSLQELLPGQRWVDLWFRHCGQHFLPRYGCEAPDDEAGGDPSERSSRRIFATRKSGTDADATHYPPNIGEYGAVQVAFTAAAPDRDGEQAQRYWACDRVLISAWRLRGARPYLLRAAKRSRPFEGLSCPKFDHRFGFRVGSTGWLRARTGEESLAWRKQCYIRAGDTGIRG